VIGARGDGRVRIFKRAGGPLVASYAADDASRVVGVTGDGTRLAVEAHDRITLVDPRSRTPIPHEAIRAPVAIEGAVVAATSDAGIVLIDGAAGTTMLRIPRGTRTSSIALNEHCVAIAGDGESEVVSRAGARLGRLRAASHIAVSDRCDLALLWSDVEPPTVHDVATGAELATLRPAMGRASSVLGFAGQDRVVLVENTQPGVADGLRVVTIWNARAGTRIAELPPTRLPATLDPARRWLTTIGTDHVVTVWSVDDGHAHSAFVGQGLLQAQTDPEGALIVAIGTYGTEAVVTNASDGRVLARWPIEHPAPMVNEVSFRPALSSIAWTADGSSIVTRSSTLAIWESRREYASSDLAKVVRAHLPWTVDGTRLTWIKGTVHGHVRRGEQPVAGATIVAEIRRPPELEGGSISNESTRGQVRHLTATTDEDGAYELTSLFPGQYTLHASQRGVMAAPVEVRVGAELVEQDLELP
jgi:hypothetical protein